jgi:hypothetical protein
MIRVTSLVLLVAAVVGLAGRAARAQLPVAPPPREIRPDGTRDPAPKPEKQETPAKAEDPAAVVDRIIKNSKDVGDKLAKTDTGADTQKKQDTILSDIDALINRQDDPPPQSDDKDKEKNQNDKKDDMNKDPMMGKDPMMNKDMPPPKGGTPMEKKGMEAGKDGMPMGGMGDPPMPMGNGRKPRMGDPMAGDKQDPNHQQPDPMKPGDKKTPGGQKDPKDPKNPGGTAGGNPGGKMTPKASLPLDEDVSKDVWGHLPDKLRQQMTQYYKEDVMPKYAELLRLYYSSFSEPGAPVPPRK